MEEELQTDSAAQVPQCLGIGVQRQRLHVRQFKAAGATRHSKRLPDSLRFAVQQANLNVRRHLVLFVFYTFTHHYCQFYFINTNYSKF
jgi:hypothetical protein